MAIKILNYLSEFFLFVLAVGMTVSNAPCEVAAYLIIFVFLLKHIITRDFKPPKSAINIFLYLYLAVVFITYLRSVYPDESLRGFLRLPKYIFLYFALIELFENNTKRMHRFFWMIIVVSTVTFLNGIFQVIFGFDLFKHNLLAQPGTFRRISASFVHPNDFGSYIITVLPLTFVFLGKKQSWQKRLILSMVCLLGLYCLFKTSSRGAWLGFLLGIIVYFFIYNKKIALLIPVIILVLIMVMPYGFSRLTGIFKAEHNTVWERTELWRGSWNMIKQHPLLGFGVNTFSRYFIQYKPADYPDLRYAHNSYLQMWSEIGIIGLLIFLAIPFTVILKAFKGIKKKIAQGVEGFVFLGALCGYIGFLAQSATDNNLFSLVLTTLFWVMTAYVIALNKALTNSQYAKK